MWLKLIGVVLTIEIAFKKGWRRLWLQCDSILLVQSFRDIDFVPWRIKNRWCNCIELTKQMYLVVGHVLEKKTLMQIFSPVEPMLITNSWLLTTIGIDMISHIIDSDNSVLQVLAPYILLFSFFDLIICCSWLSLWVSIEDVNILGMLTTIILFQP